MTPDQPTTPVNFKCPDCERNLKLTGRLPEYVACPCGANWWLKPTDAPGSTALVVQREQVGDILKEGKRTQGHADTLGTKLTETMAKQVESCKLTAELYRRYERDCAAFDLVPVAAPPRFPRIEAARREPVSFDRGELLAIRSALKLSVDKNVRSHGPSFRITAGRKLERRIDAALGRMGEGAVTGPPQVEPETKPETDPATVEQERCIEVIHALLSHMADDVGQKTAVFWVNHITAVIQGEREMPAPG